MAGLHRRATTEPEAVEATEVVQEQQEELKAPTAVEWTPPAAKQPKQPKPVRAEPEHAEPARPTPGWVLPTALLLAWACTADAFWLAYCRHTASS